MHTYFRYIYINKCIFIYMYTHGFQRSKYMSLKRLESSWISKMIRSNPKRVLSSQIWGCFQATQFYSAWWCWVCGTYYFLNELRFNLFGYLIVHIVVGFRRSSGISTMDSDWYGWLILADGKSYGLIPSH